MLLWSFAENPSAPREGLGADLDHVSALLWIVSNQLTVSVVWFHSKWYHTISYHIILWFVPYHTMLRSPMCGMVAMDRAMCRVNSYGLWP